MLRRRGGRGAGAAALRRAAGAVLAIAHGVLVGSVPGARALTASDWTRQGLGQVLFALGTRLPGAEVCGSAPCNPEPPRSAFPDHPPFPRPRKGAHPREKRGGVTLAAPPPAGAGPPLAAAGA